MNFLPTKAKTITSILIGIFLGYGLWLTKNALGRVPAELSDFIAGFVTIIIVYLIWSFSQSKK